MRNNKKRIIPVFVDYPYMLIKGVKNMAKGKKRNQGGWFGDSEGHAKAGRKGGEASQRSNNAHELTSEERSRGGSNSPGNFKYNPGRASKAGRKGGQS